MARRTGGWALALAPVRDRAALPQVRRGILVGVGFLVVAAVAAAVAPSLLAEAAWVAAGCACVAPWCLRGTGRSPAPIVVGGGAAAAWVAWSWPASPWLLAIACGLIGALGWGLEASRRRTDLDERLFEDLGSLLSAAHPYTHGHSRRVAELAQRIGKRMGLKRAELRALRRAGLLHDLGKLALTRRVLDKPGGLSEAERDEVRRHPLIGAAVAGAAEPFRGVARWVRHHHERPDGAGYPEGLRGEEIPLVCRVLAVADAFDAMTGGSGGSERSYRAAMSPEAALGELRRNSGSQFDERVVSALAEVFDELD
ncbi:MAG: HD-GYP domain-containing protein [Fimbriimonadaceae bacterium]